MVLWLFVLFVLDCIIICGLRAQGRVCGNAVLWFDMRREAVRRPWCVGRGTADGEAEASTRGLSSWDCVRRLLHKLLRKWAQQAVLPMLLAWELATG